MEWQDEAIILSVNPQGEHAAVVNLFTPQHGKWAGRVSGAQGARKRAWLVPGNTVQAGWGARLEEQLGSFSLELTNQRTAHIFDEPPRLMALSYIATLTDQCLTERLPLPLLYYAFNAACDACLQQEARQVVIAYERALLDALGYGLDLSACAVTGQRHDLSHISPNTGRAVCREEAEPYGDRLLSLPGYWLNGATPTAAELTIAAKVTGYFLIQHFYPPPRELPGLRAQLFAMSTN